MKKAAITILFLLGMLILLASAVCSCSRVQYVPLPSVSQVKDSVNLIDSVSIRYEVVKVDSVRIKDSTVIVQDKDGNIIMEKYYRETERYRSLENDYNELRRRYESLKAEKRDSVPVPYPVEKELSRWQKLKMDVGGIAIVAVLLALAAAGVLLFLRMRRR